MTRDRIDSAALLAGVDIVQLIERYVPLKKAGAEFEACCPFHNEETPSFKVNPVKQFYHCFGCGAHGDAISFLREHQGMSFSEAVEALGGRLPAAGAAAAAQEAPRAKSRTPWMPVLPAPAAAPEPPRAHLKRGLPEQVWCYRNASAVLGYVYRFRTSAGGKEVLPLVWGRHAETDAQEWRWMAFPEPRPLYGLDRLAARPEAPVLVVEGEKCADVGAAELPDLVVVSWPGGGKAVAKADWTPLAGRKVIGWPDCDAKRVPLSAADRAAGVDPETYPYRPEAEQPGVQAMTQVLDIVRGLGARVWMMRIPAPGERPDGWDIADAIAEGLTGAALADYIRDRAQLAPAGTGVGNRPPAGAGDVECGEDPNAWRRLLLRRDDKLIDCRENVYLLLRHHPAWAGVLWADEFARKIVRRQPAPFEPAQGFVHGLEWGQNDDHRLGLWMAQQERLLIRSAENLSAAISWAASEARWHPVREYLDGLVWDGTPRIDHWLVDYLGLRRREYVALSGRMFLIGMVARIYEPGCVMRAMPILEGAQFRGKSTALRILGGAWFGDTPLDLNNKDTYQVILGIWLYEIAELDSFSRADVTRIKSFISSPKDRFRAPYERMPRDHLRETVFGGTTNQDEYFKDQSGNTRFWPWKVEEGEAIHLDGLVAARDQLFAEAVVRYRAGERWYPVREEQQALFSPEQESREIADPWERIIWRHLAESTFERVTTEEILEGALKVERGKIDGARQMSTRVGIAMKRIGWEKRRETDGSRGYYYLRPAGWGRGVVAIGAGGGDEPF